MWNAEWSPKHYTAHSHSYYENIRAVNEHTWKTHYAFSRPTNSFNDHFVDFPWHSHATDLTSVQKPSDIVRALILCTLTLNQQHGTRYSGSPIKQHIRHNYCGVQLLSHNTMSSDNWLFAGEILDVASAAVDWHFACFPVSTLWYLYKRRMPARFIFTHIQGGTKIVSHYRIINKWY